MDEWTVSTLVARAKASLNDKDRFVAKLDKFFDILNCNFQIFTCQEKNFSLERNDDDHIAQWPRIHFYWTKFITYLTLGLY